MIKQLYYTSMKDGPAGHSGFQFCARSADIGDEVLRFVEQLTVYEKPRDISSDADPSEYPVNLIYTDIGSGGLAMIARVVYAGQDFSQRPGNYFAHALIMDDIKHDLARALPASMWTAPIWRTEPGPSDRLPTLHDPLPTGADLVKTAMDGLGAWRDEAPLLARLVGAVDMAMSGGKRVLVVGRDSLSVWRWIAATSCVLGPVVAPELSFCTYSYDPARTPTHVVGTVSSMPNARNYRDQFAVFDLLRGDADTGARGGEESRAAALIIGAGPDKAEKAWRIAPSLGSPTENRLARWYPILACALMRIGYELPEPDLDAAIGWLVAGHGRAELQRSMAVSTVNQRLGSLSPARQAQLVNFALTLIPELAYEIDGAAGPIEEVIVRQSIERVMRDEVCPEVMRLVTRSGHSSGSAQCTKLLPQADLAGKLKLLRWAAQAGVTLEINIVKATGRDVAAAVLLEQVGSSEIKAASSSWPALRAGMIERIAALPDVARSTILATLANDTFELADFRHYPKVGETWVSIQTAARGAPVVEEFMAICDLRRLAGKTRIADQRLIERLWPQNKWTAIEARAVVEAFPPRELLLQPVCGFLTGLLLNPTALEQEDRESWLRVAQAVSAWPDTIQRRYNVDFSGPLARCGWQVQQIRAGEAVNPAVNVKALARDFYALPPIVQLYLEEEIPLLILLYLPRPELALIDLPRPLTDAFFREIYHRLNAEHHDIELAGYIYAFRHRLLLLAGTKIMVSQIDQIITPPVSAWSRKEISDLTKAAERYEPGSAASSRDSIKKYKRQKPVFKRS